MLLDVPTQEAASIDVQELLDRCMGNLELAERVLGKLQSRFGEDMIELERALAEKDGNQIAAIAHRLKGAAANVAAHGLRDCAAKIEEAARQGLLDELPAQLEVLASHWSRLNESRLLGEIPAMNDERKCHESPRSAGRSSCEC